jgi:hypothetical protein
MMQKKRSTKKREGRRGGNGQAEATVSLAPQNVPRAIALTQRVQRVIRKVFAHSGTISTAATGFIAEQAICGNNSVQASTGWSAISGSFLEYRVIGIELFVFPLVNSQTNLTTPAPTMLAFSAYSSGLASTTYDEVAEGPQSRLWDGRKPFRYAVSAQGNLDAMQWTATNVAIPSAESYGIIIAGDLVAPAATVSAVYFRWTAKYLTELRSLD